MKMTTFDFNDGKGPVPAHKHPNGGGWVADTATVDETACVGSEARVFGNARVYDNAMVYGNAHVFDDTYRADENILLSPVHPAGVRIEMNGKQYKLVEIV